MFLPKVLRPIFAGSLLIASTALLAADDSQLAAPTGTPAATEQLLEIMQQQTEAVTETSSNQSQAPAIIILMMHTHMMIAERLQVAIEIQSLATSQKQQEMTSLQWQSVNLTQSIKRLNNNSGTLTPEKAQEHAKELARSRSAIDKKIVQLQNCIETEQQSIQGLVQQQYKIIAVLQMILEMYG